MYNEKLMIIRNRLNDEHVVSFRLYNALYKIILKDNVLIIHQEGLDVSYSYHSLKELFEKYIVYGLTLIESLPDIKIS